MEEPAAWPGLGRHLKAAACGLHTLSGQLLSFLGQPGGKAQVV